MKYYIMVFIMLFLNYLPVVSDHHTSLVQMPVEEANHNLLGDCQVIWKVFRYWKVGISAVVDLEVIRVALKLFSRRTTEEDLHAEA